MQHSIDLSRPDNSEMNRGRSRFFEAAWYLIGAPLVRSELVISSRFKCWILRKFGAEVGDGVYIKPRLRVKFPWYLTIGNHCWLGEGLWIDNLDRVSIGSNVCISQEVYICTGNHDWSHPNLKLFTRPITIEDGAWIGARSTICPGSTVGECAVTVIGSLVVKNVPPYEIHGGNPARFLKHRKLNASGASAVYAHSDRKVPVEV